MGASELLEPVLKAHINEGLRQCLKERDGKYKKYALQQWCETLESSAHGAEKFYIDVKPHFNLSGNVNVVPCDENSLRDAIKRSLKSLRFDNHPIEDEVYDKYATIMVETVRKMGPYAEVMTC